MSTHTSATKAARILLMQLSSHLKLCGRQKRVDELLERFDTTLKDGDEQWRKGNKFHPTPGHRDVRLAIIWWRTCETERGTAMRRS